MSDGSETKISHCQATKDGNRVDLRAASELLPLVYDELKRLAHSKKQRVPPGDTLQTTALVHEAYLRLVGDQDPGWNGRGHFFASAGIAMRRILVEQARKRRSLKRGNDHVKVELALELLAFAEPKEDVLAIDEALTELETTDPRKGQIVNLRYFVGLSTHETADALGVSVSTIEREWRFCRRWLFRRLNGTSS